MMVSEKTAEIRAKFNFKTPDVIQMATASICGADLIITNDKKLKKFQEIRVLILDDLK